MSTAQNVQTVKDFFAAIDRGDREALLKLVAEDMSGSFRAETGRWREHTADVRAWWICSRPHRGRWRRRPNPRSLSPRETGCW
jgi:ketosteroid isomerase-like protein